jgi:hypothetical protein
MAKSMKLPRGKGGGPPDPREFKAFETWLARKPHEWSVVIATRAALRVVPLALSVHGFPTLILPVFRATAIARFAAKHSNRATNAASAASAAHAAIEAASSDRHIYAGYAAGDAAYAVSASRAEAANSAAFAAADSAAAAAVLDSGADFATAVYAAVKHDAQRLHDGMLTAEQLARDQLWPVSAPAIFVQEEQRLHSELYALGHHWGVWTYWYRGIVRHEPHQGITEAEDAAFTDLAGRLPWDSAEAVNTEIARRLQQIEQAAEDSQSPAQSRGVRSNFITTTLADLAEVASPQPTLTPEGQLNAGPNQPFDVPTVDDELSTLPLRQRNLIRGILSDLPANAPKHLKNFLRSYDDELKARGAQPILGLLKDDADIIAAAATAPRAEDEWLEPGMRKAFDRFAENHVLFIEHFPLDAEREAIYARTPVDEVDATGKKLVEPFEDVAKAVQVAHKAGAATDDFLMAIDKMTELARVLAAQPPPPPSDQQRRTPDEINVLPEDRIQPVSVKKRTLLGALGFFERTYNLIGSTVTISGYVGIADALRPAIEMLLRFIR